MSAADVINGAARWHVEHGEALAFLRTLPDGCVDAVVTDPPYPEIDRAYGRMDETGWRDLMHGVVAECRRVLAPRGSAVFILQPNSERVGRVRPWLWEFMAWSAREWNMVQDAWWWNVAALPTVHTRREYGLMRPSVKACVWLGPENCYRDQTAVLWAPSARSMNVDRADNTLHRHPSGAHIRHGRAVATADERGGSTPYNLIPLPNNESTASAGTYGHGAGTPLSLCRWWVRYLTPRGGLVVDPFAGTSTTGVAALEHGARFIGSERMPEYAAASVQRMSSASAQGTLLGRAEGQR